jgi:hypothetical protein
VWPTLFSAKIQTPMTNHCTGAVSMNCRPKTSKITSPGLLQPHAEAKQGPARPDKVDKITSTYSLTQHHPGATKLKARFTNEYGSGI